MDKTWIFQNPLFKKYKVSQEKLMWHYYRSLVKKANLI